MEAYRKCCHKKTATIFANKLKNKQRERRVERKRNHEKIKFELPGRGNENRKVKTLGK